MNERPLKWLALGAADALLLCAVLLQWLAFSARFIDDAFISLRYADNFAAGKGLVYNPGEYVEGISNLGWTVLIAALHWAGMDPVLAGTILTLAFGIVSFLLLRFISVRLLGDSFAARIPLLLLACATVIPQGSHGLEGPMWMAVLLLAVLGVSRDSAWLTGVAMLLMAATRADGAAYVLVLVAWRLAMVRSREELRRAALLAAMGIGSILVITACRYFFYGDIVPNTVRAKVAPMEMVLPLGMKHLSAYLWDVLGPTVVLLAFVGLLHPRRGIVVLMFALAGVNAIIVLRNGGDWMQHYRLLTPFLPLLWISAALGVAAIVATQKRAAIPAATVVLALAWSLIDRNAVADTWRTGYMPAWAQLRGQNPHTQSPFMKDDTRIDVEEAAKEDDLIILEEGGLAAYLAPSVRAVEMFGLTNRTLATSRPPTAWPQPHFGVIDWHGLWAMHPTYINMANSRTLEASVTHEDLRDRLKDYALVRLGPQQELSGIHTRSLLVRTDRESLGRFALDYGSVFPAADYIGEDGRYTPSPKWNDESFQLEDGARLPQRWYWWGNGYKLSTEVAAIGPQAVRVSRTIPDGMGLLLIVGNHDPGLEGRLTARASGSGELLADFAISKSRGRLSFGRYCTFIPAGNLKAGERLVLEVDAAPKPDKAMWKYLVSCYPINIDGNLDIPAQSILQDLEYGRIIHTDHGTTLLGAGFEDIELDSEMHPWKMNLTNAKVERDATFAIEGQHALRIEFDAGGKAELSIPIDCMVGQCNIHTQVRTEGLVGALEMAIRDDNGAVVQALGSLSGTTSWIPCQVPVPFDSMTSLHLSINVHALEGTTAKVWLDDLWLLQRR